MNKIFTFLLGAFLSITMIQAQSFVFYEGEDLLENNKEITVTEIILSGQFREVDSHLKIKNVTDEVLKATVKQTILDGPTNGGNLTFCFTSCLNPSLNPEEQTGDIDPNSFYNNFHMGFYLPDLGISKIQVQYEIFSTDNPEDISTVIVNYDPSETTNLTNNKGNNSLAIYQNGNQINIDYDLNTSGTLELCVYNVTGTVVGNYTLNDNKGLFTLPEILTRGLYIAAIKEANNTHVLQKFMVK